MCLWSLHPKYLDRQGLLAVWREGLLAQKVLEGATRGYRQHPQLLRFRAHADPQAAIGAYLSVIAEEGQARGFSFDRSRIAHSGAVGKIPVTDGQMRYEWQYLKAKLRRRDPVRLLQMRRIDIPQAHPLFAIVRGDVESWEKVPADGLEQG